MKFILLVLSFILPNFIFSQIDSIEYDIESVIVTTTKKPELKERIADVVYVITKQDIENFPGSSLSELLNQIPGINIQETYGAEGSPLQYNIRGGKPKDALFMINGLPISDDSHIQNFQDLNLINLQQIEQIEVIIGGATTLYGSNAATGAINIITSKDQKKSLNSFISYGSWNSLQTQINSRIAITGKLSFQPFFNYSKTDGFSAAQSQNNSSFDEDGSEKIGIGQELNFENEKISLKLRTTYNQHQYDFDGGAFFDSEDEQENNQFYNAVNSTWKNKYGVTNFNIGLISTNRDQSNPFGRDNDQLFSSFESRQLNVDLFQQKELLNESNLIVGVYAKNTKTNQSGVDFFSQNFEQNLSADSANFRLVDPYLSFQYGELKNLTIDVGARLHTHSQYDSKSVFHFKPMINLFSKEDVTIQLKGGVYSSYNTPSLYQLYSNFGSTNLTPESSTTYEATVNSSIDNKFSFSATYFDRKEINRFGFSNQTFLYTNLTEDSQVNGLEINATYNYNEKLNATLFYAKAKQDLEVNQLRLPSYEFGSTVIVKPSEKLTSATTFRSVGDRDLPFFNNSSFQTEIIDAETYHVLNETMSYQINNKARIFGSVNNILNQDIIDNFGYNGQDRNIRIGFNFSVN